MLEGAFSFRGRVGRVKYLVGQLVLLPIVGVIVAVVGVMIATAQRSMASLAFFVLLGLIIVAGIFWYSLSLQVRRIRDIGWSPAVVLGGFFFLCVADAIVARAYPALATAGHHSTLVGLLLNLGLTGALYLWPGNGELDHDAMASIAACFDAPAIGATPAVAVPGGAPAMLPRTSTVPRTTFGKRGRP